MSAQRRGTAASRDSGTLESQRARIRGRAANVWLGCALALLVGACATPGGQGAGGGGPNGGDDGSLQEITVTGSRAGPSGRVSRIDTTPGQAGQGASRKVEEKSAPQPGSSVPSPSAIAPLVAGTQVDAIGPRAMIDAYAGIGLAPPAPVPSAATAVGRGGAPLSRVRPGEEIWVIETAAPRVVPTAAVDDDSPGSGTMLALVVLPPRDGERPSSEPVEVPLPLEHTDVHAVVTGYIGAVDVTQQFTNPYDEKIEAVYMFPLPEKAAVNEFVMTIGDRKIRGILREKEEAQQIYQDARAQGYRASLLVQRRPNVFEQKVANIEPGKRIDVSIRYFHTLAYEDGWYSFVFPTVVGPRYNPIKSRDPIESVSRNAVAEPAKGSAVRYLRPSERSAHDIGIAVDLDAGVAIEELEASHAITTVRDGANRAHVALAAASTIPNRDFVLRFRVAGDTIKSNLVTYTDPQTKQGYFTMMIYPPQELHSLTRAPVEMVFVIDTSGSMSGRPLQQAASAVEAALDRLDRNDTFQILNFSNDVRALFAAPRRATAENLDAGTRYLRALRSGGGTEMLGGIRAALSFERDPQRTRYVTFLTDGYIGNETEIFGEVHRLIGDARIFSFGVGNAVNRYLLDGLAVEGRGAAAYLALDDSADEVMRYYFERISHPALTDVAIDWNGLAVDDMYPRRLPDLFVGRPVVVTGKFSGAADEVTVRGRAGAKPVALRLAADAAAPAQPAVRSLWARLKIEDLARRQAWAPGAQVAGAIRETALEYGLMSAYTSFVAVDASERTAGGHGTTVQQAVPVPDGVRYDTSVAER